MSDEEERLPEYPEKDTRSGAYQVARTAIDVAASASLIPGASYAIGQIVERFVAAPLQKRRDQWFTKVGEGLRDLQDRLEGFDASKLDENDDFISAVAEATTAAVRTAKQEKIEALRNGVLNIAAGMQIEDILRGAFFGYIERFSPAHARVLKLLADPSSSQEMKLKASQMMAGAQMSVLEAALPASVISPGALSRVLSDLHREGLADTSGMMAMGTPGVFLAKRSTGVGDAFLQFIADPL
jgi:hypothetical protein